MQLELWLNIYLLEKNYIKNNNTFGLNCWTYRKHKSNTKVGTNQSQPKMLYFFLPNIQTLPPSLYISNFKYQLSLTIFFTLVQQPPIWPYHTSQVSRTSVTTLKNSCMTLIFPTNKICFVMDKAPGRSS